MPIRINLLAEAKIKEELRRRDPVKRAMFFGAFLVVFAFVWSSSLQLQVMIAKKDLSGVQAEILNCTNQYQAVLVSQGMVAKINEKLTALQQLSDARFLHGNYLNALQLATMDGVQLMRIRLNQTYEVTPAVPKKTDGGRTVPGRPGTSTEKLMLMLDAKDSSASPGDAVDKFKERIAEQAYFKTLLNPTNGVKLISLSSPQISDGKPFVLFNLECYFKEKNQ
jgi:hypothetical protein